MSNKTAFPEHAHTYKGWERLAAQVIADAPNDDWRRPGGVTIGLERDVPISYRDYNTDKQKVIGMAQAVPVLFNKPLKDEMGVFVGFVLIRFLDGKKEIAEAHPIIGKLSDDDFKAAAFRILAGKCPECHALKSFSIKSRRKAGRECVILTYRCSKCGFAEKDALD